MSFVSFDFDDTAFTNFNCQAASHAAVRTNGFDREFNHAR
jgi:hypothetical protein